MYPLAQVPILMYAWKHLTYEEILLRNFQLLKFDANTSFQT